MRTEFIGAMLLYIYGEEAFVQQGTVGGPDYPDKGREHKLPR